MIRTVADFLDELRAKESVLIASSREEVRHPTIVGDMYEGLTRRLLQTAVFDGLDLRVADGLLVDSAGQYSRQIDCMLVTGEGRALPNTTHYVYHISQLIAVVEVKATLYGGELAEAYDNLTSVRKLVEPADMPIGPFDTAWRSIFRRDLPDDPAALGDKELFYHALAVEAHQPLRVAIGYAGYRSERSLRRGFVNYLGDKQTTSTERKEGYGPASLPNLVICRDVGLVKCNGMPYGFEISNSGEWMVLGSFGGSSTLYLLELLWTRLASKFDLPPVIFGDDLEIESINPFLWCRPGRIDNSLGWEYSWTDVKDEVLASRPKTLGWAPAPITDLEAVILYALGQTEAICVDSDDEYVAYVSSQGGDPRALAESLTSKGLTYFDDNGCLRYITAECAVAYLPDGRAFAGENNTGRLVRWIDAVSSA